jgi:hypothetical protein
MRLPLLGESKIHCKCRRMTSGKTANAILLQRDSLEAANTMERGRHKQKAHPGTRIAMKKQPKNIDGI